MKLSYRNIIQYFLFGSLVFFIGCDNETPFPTTYNGDSVFYANGQLDNNDLLLEAGQEDFYMFTDLQLNNQNTLQFSGSFQKNDLCTNGCDEKLKIIINNHQEGTNFILDSALYVGNYSLEPAIQVGNSEYVVNFNAITIGNFAVPLTYAWDFGDGNISTTASPTTTYLDDNGHNVSLFVTEANGQQSFYRDSINSLLLAQDCAINLDFTSSLDSLTGSINYSMWAIDSSGANSNYDWEIDTGQGPLSLNGQDSVTFSIPSNINQFEVCVQNFSNDCFVQFCKDFTNQSSNNNNNHQLSFEYNTQNIVIPGDSSFFSMVIIEYTTPNGVFYSSELGSQANSTFEILSIDNHDDNERNQTTKKLAASVNCKLYNQNGDSFDFISNDLIFGVSTSN